VSCYEDQMSIKTVVESMIENRYIDLILLLTISLAFITLLIISASSV
jgi:hypothetical protein